MNDLKSLYQEWLDKVEEDEFAGKKILDAERFAAPACFHFQQMAEKSLKALAEFLSVQTPKIHDLIALAGLLEPKIPSIKDFKDDLELLSRYYIETRYPGDYPEFTLTEAQEAYTAAKQIKEFVLNCIRQQQTS